MVHEKKYASFYERTGNFRTYAARNIKDSSRASIGLDAGSQFARKSHARPFGNAYEMWWEFKHNLVGNTKVGAFLKKAFPYGRASMIKNQRKLRDHWRIFGSTNSRILPRVIFASFHIWLVAKYVWPICNTQNRFDNAVEYRWKRHDKQIGWGWDFKF